MKNWEDVEGWDTFHAEHYKEDWVNYSFLITLIEAVIDRKNVRNIWFPGCGTSTVTKVFTELGFNVWVTDVSDFAIAIQHELTQKSVEQIGMRIGVPNEQNEYESYTIVEYFRKFYEDYNFEECSTFNVEKHDFRTPFHHAKVDCIVNMRAFQGFSTNTQRQVARVHYDALKLGGMAFFQTANVVGKADVELKLSLLDAGFHVQGFKTISWFWDTLSGILTPNLLRSYGTIFKDHYWSDSDRKKYRKILENLNQEYSLRWERELDETSYLLNDGETKVAEVMCWTG